MTCAVCWYTCSIGKLIKFSLHRRIYIILGKVLSRLAFIVGPAFSRRSGRPNIHPINKVSTRNKAVLEPSVAMMQYYLSGMPWACLMGSSYLS